MNGLNWEHKMSTPQEIEVIEQLLDSSRKVQKYIAALPAEHIDVGIAIKRKFNELLDKAIEVYFFSEEKAMSLAKVLLEVQDLLEHNAEPKKIYERLVA
jgi:hypothetical protein